MKANGSISAAMHVFRTFKKDPAKYITKLEGEGVVLDSRSHR